MVEKTGIEIDLEKDSNKDIKDTTNDNQEEPKAEGKIEDETSTKDSKKKRVADRQITKDDDDDDDGNDDENIGNGGFRKADAAVLAKRKILRVKRGSYSIPVAVKNTTTANGTSKPCEEEEKKSNPFATATLVPGGKDTSGSSATAPKVFGASTSFTGFQTTTSSTTKPAFNFGSSFSNSSSGFGNKDSKGEKSSATTTTEEAAPKWNFSFGKSTSSAATNGGNTPSTAFGAFGSSTTSKPFSFGAGASIAASSTISTTGAVVQLPENVKLTTGEEEESIRFENRCKTHMLVTLDDIDPDAAADSSSSTTKNSINQQSVPPSASSITNSIKIDSGAASKENYESKEEVKSSEKTSESKEDISNNDSEKESKICDEKPSSAKEEGQNKEQKTKWQEIGIGPLRLLRNKTSKEQLRLVQRRESVPHGTATKVIVNMFLWKESKIHRPSEKHVQVTTLSAGKKSKTYLFKFKLQREASDLEKCLQEELESAQSISVKS